MKGRIRVKKTKFCLSLLLLLAISGLMIMNPQEVYAKTISPSFTGIVKSDGKYYYYQKGKLIKNKIITVKEKNDAKYLKYVYDLSAEDGQVLRKTTYKTNGDIVYKWYDAEKLANERAKNIMGTLSKQYKNTYKKNPNKIQKLQLAWAYSTKYAKTIKKKSNGLLNGFQYQFNEPSRKDKEWRAQYAVYMYEQGNGRCYSFACSFGYLARASGYQNARIYVGETQRSNGSGYTPHAWVTIEMKNVHYYFDPQQKNKHPNKNFYMMKNGVGGIGYYRGEY